MLYCEKCGELVNKCEKIIVQKRQVEYYSAVLRKKGKAKNKHKSFKFVYDRAEVQDLLAETDTRGKPIWEFVQDKQSKGWETVAEMALCKKCYKETN